MYGRVLVPLDGSELAECALPEVERLAKGGLVGEVLLLSVIETHSVAFAEGIDLSALKASHYESAQVYLDRVRNQLFSKGIRTTMKLMEGNAASVIVSYAKEKNVGLIIIATHGYSGMKQLMFGSVSLRVLHDSYIPVLLIRPESCRL